MILFSFFRPRTAFLLGVFFLFNGFGLVDWYFKEMGFAKSIDIGIGLCLLSILIYTWSNRKPNVYQFNGAMSKITIYFVSYIIFLVLFTFVVQGQDIILSFYMGRTFIAPLIFYATVIFLYENEDWEKYIKVVFVISIIGSVVYIVQYFVDIPIVNELFLVSQQEFDTSKFGAREMKRLYGGMTYPIYLIAGGLFAYLIERKIEKKKYFYWGLLGVVTLVPIISFGRGFILGHFVTLLTVLFFSNASKLRKIWSTFITFSIFILIILVSSNLYFDSPFTLFEIFYERMFSAQEDLIQGKGTFKPRMDLAADSWEVFLENPMTGAGFIHDKSGLYSKFGGVLAGHNGYMTILTYRGIIGFLLFLAYSIIIVYYSYKVTKLNVPYMYHAIALATIGNIAGGYLNMISTDSFATGATLAQFAIVAGILHFILVKYESKTIENR